MSTMSRGGGDVDRGRGGGKRGGKGRPSGPLPRDVLVSKKLSKLLRHDAEKVGLALGEGGYVRVDALLANTTMKSMKTNFAEIRRIVAENSKQRFSLIRDPSLPALPFTPIPTELKSASDTDNDPSHYLIRANQGHTISVSSEGLLTPLKLPPEGSGAESGLPAVVVHGTRRGAWPAIVASGGLKPMKRTHVHFATGVPKQLLTPKHDEHNASTADPLVTEDEDAAGAGSNVVALPDKKDAPLVVSGMRNTSTVMMYVDLPRALAEGVPFWMSENGVVLSEGNQDGVVPLWLFKKVEEKGGRVLVENGIIMKVDSKTLEVLRDTTSGSEQKGKSGV